MTWHYSGCILHIGGPKSCTSIQSTDLALSGFAGVNVTTIANAISAGRDMLDGTADNDDEGIFDATTGDYHLAPVDGNAVAFSRSPSMVLQVAYLNSNCQAGGFFPDGVNGAIQCTTSS